MRSIAALLLRRTGPRFAESAPVLHDAALETVRQEMPMLVRSRALPAG